MPIHLPACTRRQFLQGALAAGGALLARNELLAARPAADTESWALLSDIHIAANRQEMARGMNMTAHLEQVGREVLALSRPPAGILVNGDCALREGKDGDYRTLVELLQPLRQAGLPVHLAMGNHDHRQHFWTAAVERKDAAAPLAGRHLSIVETPRVNWFVLDSLKATNVTPGELGEEQRAWLAKALDARADKPAVIVAHHNLDPGNPKTSGLTDSDALLALLVPRKQVKAYIYGHTHRWRHSERDGLHLVNLPAVAYPFRADEPVGWVHCRLRADGASLELHSLDQKHAAHGETVDLKWRPA